MKLVHARIAIMCTPRTPRLKNITVMLILYSSFFCTISKAQENSLEMFPKLDSLELSLKIYHNRLWLTEREEFKNLNKKKWWYYLPTFGLQFGLPSVQFGTSTFVQLDRDKNIRGQKLKSIDMRRELEYNKELTELKSQYNIIKIKNSRLQIMKIIHEKEQQIFDIYKEAFIKREMTPEEFKLKELSHLKEYENFEIFKLEVMQSAWEIMSFAHWNEKQKPVWFDINECEVLSRKD